MKKFLLSALMFGFLLFALGNVSAADCIEDQICDTDCHVIIDEPIGGEYYDPVTIRWHYEGSCNPLEAYIAYQEESCGSPFNWNTIEQGINPSETTYEWDVSNFEDGEYCIAVNIDQLSGPDAGSTTGLFFLDLTDPILTKTVGEPNVECEEEECDYYVNVNTPITLECVDEGEFASGVDYIEYRINGGEWTTYTIPFTFSEDSEHILEARCVDNVGKEDTDTEIFFVDSVGPEITKYVTGPQIGECPPEEDGDECYIAVDTTEIDVEISDPDPHAVGADDCYYWYYVGDARYPEEGVYRTLPIVFHEESAHELYLVCKDLLGNEVRDIETFFVDATDPVTEISFEGPYYTDGYAQWIDGVSTVVLLAQDQEPHPAGVEDTFYRFGLVDDSYCNGEEDGYPEVVYTSVEDEDGWNLYEGAFSIPEESCHAIEYYSVDSLGNEEIVKTEYVFVDKTAPLTDKDVGNPSHDCNSAWESLSGNCEEDWDWIVTMETPITLSCEDQSPHPSGVKGIWYRIVLDGDFEGAEWIFVPASETTIWFTEESEHQLDFYCVDNVDKQSETDSELFKVEGEELTIPLYQKWNLISIPFPLMSNNIDEVFSQISDKVEIVWSYDEDGWHVYSPEGPSDLDTIEPGYGYWVKATEDTELVVGGSLLSPAPGVPPSRQLQEGWNLIGRYGLDEDQQAYCALFSLVDTTIGHPRWSALFSYEAEGTNDHFVALDVNSPTNPGEGYWIEMDEEDLYSPSTTCWGFPWD